MFNTKRPTIRDVDKAFEKLKKVKRPDADNEGDSANDPACIQVPSAIFVSL